MKIDTSQKGLTGPKLYIWEAVKTKVDQVRPRTRVRRVAVNVKFGLLANYYLYSFKRPFVERFAKPDIDTHAAKVRFVRLAVLRH